MHSTILWQPVAYNTMHSTTLRQARLDNRFLSNAISSDHSLLLPTIFVCFHVVSFFLFFVFGWSCQYFFTDQIFHKKSYLFPCLKRFPKKMFTMTQTSPIFWSGTLSVITWWWYRCHSTKTQPNKENRDQIFRSKNLTPSLTCTQYNSILYNVQLSLWPKSWINCGAPLTCVASFIWDHRDFHFMSILYSRPRSDRSILFFARSMIFNRFEQIVILVSAKPLCQQQMISET